MSKHPITYYPSIDKLLAKAPPPPEELLMASLSPSLDLSEFLTFVKRKSVREVKQLTEKLLPRIGTLHRFELLDVLLNLGEVYSEDDALDLINYVKDALLRYKKVDQDAQKKAVQNFIDKANNLTAARRPSALNGGQRKNVYLDEESIGIATKLGNGNMSEGIRIALRLAFAMNK